MMAHCQAAFSWALLHSIWQAGVLWLLVSGLRQRKFMAKATRLDHLLKGCMFAIAICFAVTFTLYLNAATSPSSNQDAGAMHHFAQFQQPAIEHSHSTTASLSPLQTIWELVYALSFDWVPILFWLWLPGGIWLLTKQGHGYFRLAHLQRRPPPAEIQALLNTAQAELGLQRPVTLWLVPNLKSPCTHGLLEPQVLLPEAFGYHASSAWLTMVFHHELAHIQRRDVGLNLCLMPMQALFWHLPFWYPLIRAIREQREICCDEKVIHRGFKPLDYADLLLALGRRQDRPQLQQVAIANGPLLSRVRRMVEPAPSTKNSIRGIGKISAALGLGWVLTYTIFGVGVLPTKSDLRSAFLKQQVAEHMAAKNWQDFTTFFEHAHQHRHLFKD